MEMNLLFIQTQQHFKPNSWFSVKVTCGSTEFTNIVNFTGSGKTAVQTDGFNTPTGAIKVGVGFDYHYIIVRHGIVIDVLDTKSGYAEIWKWQQ